MRRLVMRMVVLWLSVVLLTSCNTSTSSRKTFEECINEYGIDLDKLPGDYSDISSLKERILSVCRLDKLERIGNTMLYEYSSDYLSDAIPLCKTIEEIYIYTGPLSIVYLSNEGKRITLLYESEPIGIIVIDQNSKTGYQWINGKFQSFSGKQLWISTKNPLKSLIPEDFGSSG